jgi:hypothetical protein
MLATQSLTYSINHRNYSTSPRVFPLSPAAHLSTAFVLLITVIGWNFAEYWINCTEYKQHSDWTCKFFSYIFFILRITNFIILIIGWCILLDSRALKCLGIYWLTNFMPKHFKVLLSNKVYQSTIWSPCFLIFRGTQHITWFSCFWRRSTLC